MAIDCASGKTAFPIFNTHCQHSVSITPKWSCNWSISCSICTTVRVIILKQNSCHTILLLMYLQRPRGCCTNKGEVFLWKSSQSEPLLSVSVTPTFLPSFLSLGARVTYLRSLFGMQGNACRYWFRGIPPRKCLYSYAGQNSGMALLCYIRAPV